MGTKAAVGAALMIVAAAVIPAAVAQGAVHNAPDSELSAAQPAPLGRSSVPPGLVGHHVANSTHDNREIDAAAERLYLATAHLRRPVCRNRSQPIELEHVSRRRGGPVGR